MITSADNPKVKLARALLEHRGRRQHGDRLCHPAGPHAAVHALLDEQASRWWRRARLVKHLRSQLARARKTPR